MQLEERMAEGREGKETTVADVMLKLLSMLWILEK